MGICDFTVSGRFFLDKTQMKSVGTYPEVIVASRPDLVSVTDHVRDQTRTKVTSQVHGVTRLPTEAGTKGEDQETDHQGHQVAGAVVGQAEEAEHEDGRGDVLGEEHAGGAQERSRVGTEDAGSRVVARDGADVATALENVDGRPVVGVNNSSGGHGAQQLGDEVDGELAPWELAVHATGKCDGWVQVATGLAGDVDTDHDTDTEAHVALGHVFEVENQRI